MGDGVKEALFVNGMLQFSRPSVEPRKIEVLEDNERCWSTSHAAISCASSKLNISHTSVALLTTQYLVTYLIGYHLAGYRAKLTMGSVAILRFGHGNSSKRRSCGSDL